jgi:DNA/RNA endonuclease G (NUC1)
MAHITIASLSGCTNPQVEDEPLMRLIRAVSAFRRSRRWSGHFLSVPVLAVSALVALQGCDRSPAGPDESPAVQASVQSASAARPEVVISQIYGGGGNSGAPYNRDYVELFNPGDVPVDMNGWSVQYASATGSTWLVTALGTGAATGIIQPGGYYLVQMGGGTTGDPLPAPDDFGTTNMAAGSGKVLLSRTATGLAGLCPVDAVIVDRVNFGAANCNADWGGTTPTLSNTTAALRGDDGCTYTGSVTADFAAGAPTPRTSASPTKSCGVPPGEPALVTVTPATATVIVGATQAFSAVAHDAAGQGTPATFTWTSGDEAIATIDAATGVATAVGEGTVQITATTANDVSGSALLTVTPPPPPPDGSGVVISQVYGGGGNSGATYTHDFVELFNRGDETVAVGGWTVQYASAAGTSWIATTLPAGATIPPGGYYLIQLATNNVSIGAPLPAPDATGTTNMAAGSGKVVLAGPGAVLSGACPDDASIADRVNYGTANCAAEWGTTPTLSNTTAAHRNEGGCFHTGDVSTDFSRAPPSPRNSGTSLNSCAPPPPVEPTGLVITEFLADPDGADTLGEWFELYNAGTEDIDLFGWQLRSNSSTGVEAHTIAASVIVPAGGFVVLGNNANAATNGGVDIAYSYGGDIILNNSNTDWLTLKRPDGTLEDSVSYSARDADGTIVNPQYVPAVATSRVLIDINLDNSVAASSNWQNSTLPFGDGRNRGSPGWGAYGVGGPAASIMVAPASASVLAGGSTTFTAIPLDALGRVTDASTVSWSSANPAIATVDATTGVATGVSEGIVVITASAGAGVEGSATLAVVDPDAPASITVSIDPSWVPVGYTKRPFPTVRNHGGAVIFVDLEWTVSDPSLAEIVYFDGRAYVATLGAGTIVVTATAANGVSGSRALTILPADAPTSAVYRNHVEFGIPLRDGAPDGILIEKTGFVTSYNPDLGGPNWVSWNLNATHFGTVTRCNCFSPDLAIPDGVFRVVDSDYIGSGYDRGHMVQSESRTTTEQENAATFLFTNILPQAPVNNQDTWFQFENHLNNLARQQGREVYVIAGGDYADEPPTINNAGTIPIPDFTWKIAVVMEGGQGLADVTTPQSLEVIAVRMPNLVATAVGGIPWQTYLTTVDALEEITGYDFLAELPDWIERIVESGTRPPVAVAGGPYTGIEGSAVHFDGSASSDPDGDVITFAWDFGDGATGTGAAPTHTYADNGDYTVRLIVEDPFGAADTTYTTATIANAPPVIISLDVPASAAIGTAATVTVTYSDPGTLDTHTAVIDWGDGISTTVAGAAGTASASHAWAATGFYTVHVTVTDNDGASAQRTAATTIAVYDPDGAVTGGGNITVPAGALAADPAATGRANLSFTARYIGGASSGQLEFHLDAASFRFTADAVQTLVVNGARATVLGTGRMQGDAAGYSYTLHVQDGRAGQARARLVIRDADGDIVFDSLPGEAEGVMAPVVGNITVR